MPRKFYDIIPPKGIKTFKRQIEQKKPTHSQERDVSDSELKEIKFEKEIDVSSQHVEEVKPKRFFSKSIFFFLVFLGLISISAFVFFYNIKIEIWPKTNILGLETSVIIDSNIEKSDSFWLEQKVIFGKVFSDQRSASENFSTSGKMLKEVKARGIIRIYNNYSTSPRALVPSRFVSANGKLFWSVEKITIPGARYERGKLIPGEIDVEVQAAEPGEDYNIEATTFALPALAGSPLYTAIYGKSFSSMKDGFKGEVPQATQEDLEKAKNILADKLEKESREFLKASLPADFVLLDEAISQGIIESNSSVLALAEAESFDSQVKIKSEGIGFKRADIENFSKDFIMANIPRDQEEEIAIGYEFFIPVKKIEEVSLEINYSPRLIELESGKMTLDLKIGAKIYSDIDLIKLKEALRGKSLKESRVFLDNLPQVTKIEIKCWPVWRRRAPEELDRIEIKLRLQP